MFSNFSQQQNPHVGMPHEIFNVQMFEYESFKWTAQVCDAFLCHYILSTVSEPHGASQDSHYVNVHGTPCLNLPTSIPPSVHAISTEPAIFKTSCVNW